MTTSVQWKALPLETLPDVINVHIMGFDGNVHTSEVSRAFNAWNRRAMALEWRRDLDNPSANFLKRKIEAQEGIDFNNPDRISQCFLKLLDKQSEIVSQTRNGCMRLEWMATAYKNSFSMTRFLELEKLVESTQKIIDEDLVFIWRHLHPELRLNAELLEMSPSEIRQWMNDPQNEMAFDGIHVLDLSEHFAIRTLPSEISRLRNLTHLFLQHNKLYYLPNELALLDQLFQLDLAHNEYTKVPDVIKNMRGLYSLNLNANQITEIPDFLAETELSKIQLYGNPITVLSDAIYRRFLSNERMDDDLSLNCVNGGEIYLPLELDQYKLEVIPFTKWFKQTFTIPYPDYFEFSICTLLLFPLIAIAYVINRFLIVVVEPVISWIRDMLGYSRLVKIK